MDDTKPSKSARKRAYLALQKLGEELITLRESDLQAMPLDEELRDAVLEARHMKAHGALRRQKQYIGKLMGRIDPEPIREALERLRRNS
ncbi:MAG TPA: ribosome biogenesis factor YjgA [Woeseiaceae bacterium]|nr:ribosome biogenesis factor YjgA [Woeseiaceae bacterium]